MSLVLARAAISLNEYFSVTQIDAAICGFVGLMLWWWLPSKRPQPPAPGQPERLERMADRIDALVAGLLLAVLVNVRLQLTDYVKHFDVSQAPLLHTYRISMPLTASVLYLGWLHVLVPLWRAYNKPAQRAAPAAAAAAAPADGTVRVAKVAASSSAAAAEGGKAAGGAAKSLSFDAMDRVVQLWNMFLSAGSFVILVGLIDSLIGYGNQTNWSLVELIADTQRLRWSGPGFFLLFVFQMSKFIELFDTVLLVARARPVVFLHWYHHTSVLVYCWVSVLVTYAPGWWFGTVNCFVHSIMYFYYYRSGCGVKLAYDKFITTIQIVQMAIGIALTLSWLYLHITSNAAMGLLDPASSTLMVGLSVGMYASYLFLFAAFYVNRYWKKSSANAAAAKQARAPKAVTADS